MMGRNIYLIFLSLALPLLTFNLQTGVISNQPYYSPPAYQKQLTQRQNILTSKASLLQDQLDAIEAIIQDSEDTTSSKIVRLQEGIADERDQLYELEQFLKIPFALRKCSCKALSNDSRVELLTKIAAVEKSITELQTDLQACTDQTCPKYQQLTSSLQNMQAYMAQVKEIFYSECCKARREFLPETAGGITNLNQSLYKDNLDATNWYYGSTTEQEYRLKMFEVTTKYNTKKCPLEFPYADHQLNECKQCEGDGKFNLGLRACFRCHPNSYLNLTTSLCQACPPKSLLNKATQTCNSCPSGSFLNTTSIQCQPCKLSAGEFYNAEEQSCIKCSKGMGYDSLKKSCRPCNASAAQFVNPTSFRCEFCPLGDFLNSTAQACQRCGNNSYFNRVDGKCQACPANQEFNYIIQKCESCSSSQYFNSNISACDTCPLGSEYSQNKGKCVCPLNLPVLNQQFKVCEGCPANHTWDNNLGMCLNNNNIGFCPPLTPFYNTKTHLCEACPTGTAFNHQQFTCQPLRHHLFI